MKPKCVQPIVTVRKSMVIIVASWSNDNRLCNLLRYVNFLGCPGLYLSMHLSNFWNATYLADTSSLFQPTFIASTIFANVRTTIVSRSLVRKLLAMALTSWLSDSTRGNRFPNIFIQYNIRTTHAQIQIKLQCIWLKELHIHALHIYTRTLHIIILLCCLFVPLLSCCYTVG